FYHIKGTKQRITRFFFLKLGVCRDLFCRRRAVTNRTLKFIDFEARRRRARTLAGGTRAFFSAYHRKDESSESRTLKRVRGLLAPGAGVFSFLIPGVALADARLTRG